MAQPSIPLTKIEEMLRDLDKEERAMRSRISEIALERRVLGSLRREAVGKGKAAVRENASTQTQITLPDSVAPMGNWKRQMVEYVAAHPGKAVKEYVDVFEAMGFCRASKRPRKTIQTLFAQLHNEDERLAKDTEGRVTVR